MQGGLLVNIDAAPIEVAHAHLERMSDESPYRSRCPTCGKGALLVYRDPTTFRLIDTDRCTWCAQTIIYTDGTIAGEAVFPVTARGIK
jgi:uncharacterized protein (DUF983 family)